MSAGVGPGSDQPRWRSRGITLSGVFLCLYTIVEVIYLFLPPLAELALFLMLTLVVTFLKFPLSRTRNLAPLDLLCILLAVITGLYIVFQHDTLMVRMGIPTSLDVAMGIVGTLLVLEAARRTVGWILPALGCLALGYAAFGTLLPVAWGGHSGFSLQRIVTDIYLTEQGIYGVALAIMFRLVVLFIVFGVLLSATGGTSFLIDLSQSLFNRFAGGPGKVAVVASGLFGTISGSAVANVVGTGVFTIPLMKRVGYSPRFAGAVEAVASTGGQIMPPVMGAAAFVMADMMGVPYLAVVKAAVLPAILYYLAVFSAVHLVAVRDRLTGLGEEEIRAVREGMWQRVHLLVPLVYLVWQILDGYSPTTASVRASAAAVAVSWIRRATRMGWREVLRALRGGAEKSIAVAVPCATAGIIIGVIVQSGLGLKLTTMLLALSGGKLLPTLILAMVVCIILGMGMPTTSAYILTAVLMAPALVNLGIPDMAAHLFVFYFACLSMVTPPVALAAYAAAGLAGASVWETGWVAFGMSLPSFIVAYGFVYNQGLILNAPLAQILAVTVTAALGTIALAGAVVRFLIVGTTRLERALLFVAAPMLIVPEFYTDIAGLLVLVAVVGRQLYRVRAGRRQAAPDARRAGAAASPDA